MERRTWNTPAREDWNELIRQLLRGIDRHNAIYFRTGNTWHLEKAAQLRAYVTELKDWIKIEEDS